MAVTCTLLLQLVIFIVAFLDVVEGYIHLLSPVKASRNSAISYFNCHIQTADNKVVRAVCYSPKKRVNLQQAFQSKSPVHIKGVKRSFSKSFSSDKSTEEIQITKQAKITPTTANFQYNLSAASHLRFVTECVSADVYETVDIKAKIVKKAESKQWIVRNNTKIYKTECFAADETDSIKLIIWEDLIDKIFSSKSYHLKNLTVRVFDDEKYLNTNESTIVEEIDDLVNVNLTTSEIKENLLTGQCLAINIAKKQSCIICNATVGPLPEDNETYTCESCHNTCLTTSQKTKLVCTLTIKTEDGKLAAFTCFNDAIQSFLTSISNHTPLSEIDTEQLKILFLRAGSKQMIVDMASHIIDQFIL